MARFEVTTMWTAEFLVKVVVEADDKSGAMLAVAEAGPSIRDSKGFSARLQLKSPPNVEAVAGVVKYLSQTSGGEKVKKLS